MPPHGHYGDSNPIRWNKQLGQFEMQCVDCRDKREASFWPITLEFWYPRTLRRCRACDLERRSRLEREKRRTDPVFRASQNRKAAAYYQANSDVLRPKNTLRNRAWREKRRAA